MASLLTSTSAKSSLLYLGLFLCMILGSAYFLLLKKQSTLDNFRKQAFKLNFVAFKNGIQLANYKFVAGKQANSLLNRWVINETGLDYNELGFPIGTDLQEAHFPVSINQSPQIISKPKLPEKTENCIQIWNFVLSKLRPEISDSPRSTNYWATLNHNKTCIFRSAKVPENEIHYQANKGTVDLISY